MTLSQPNLPYSQGARFLIGIMLFGLGVACFVEREIFFNPYALNDDVRNQVYWMAQIIHPQYFANDYIGSYFTNPLVVSPILAFIYRVAAYWISPITLTQWLPLLLVLLATFFLFKFTEKYRNASYAFWICFVFNCAIWIFKNLAGGLSRAFIYPLLFFFLWQLSENRWGGIALGLCLCSVIYPPAFLLALTLLILETVRFYKKDGYFKARMLSLGTGLLGSLAILAYRVSMQPLINPFGPLSSNQSTDGMRDFYIGGRIVLFPWGNLSSFWPAFLKPLAQLLERMPHLYILIPTFTFIVVLLAYQLFLKKHWGALLIPGRIWRLLLSSAILYVLAWVFLFYLYVPERYLQYTLPLIPTFILGTLFYRIQHQNIGPRKRFLTILVCLAIGMTGLFWRDDLMNPRATEKELFAYLKTLPINAMIAAPPGLASNIPLYSFRRVFVSNEAYIPFHQLYFKKIKGRLQNLLSAYYTSNPHILSKFLRQHHIDYLVVQLKDFSPEQLNTLAEKSYYAFNPVYFEALKNDTKAGYLLKQVPAELSSFETTGLKVIPVKPLLTYLETHFK